MIIHMNYSDGKEPARKLQAIKDELLKKYYIKTII